MLIFVKILTIPTSDTFFIRKTLSVCVHDDIVVVLNRWMVWSFALICFNVTFLSLTHTVVKCFVLLLLHTYTATPPKKCPQSSPPP